MTETLDSGCGNNLGGLRKLILFRATEVLAISAIAIQLAEGFTSTQILFPDNNAEYQDALKESENGPFTELAITSNLGKNNGDLVQWCNRNKRRKYVAYCEDQNGFAFVAGSRDFPLTLSFSSGTGIADQDKNNRQLALRGRAINSGSAILPIEETEEGSFLTTEDSEIFIVTESGDRLSII